MTQQPSAPQRINPHRSKCRNSRFRSLTGTLRSPACCFGWRLVTSAVRSGQPLKSRSTPLGRRACSRGRAGARRLATMRLSLLSQPHMAVVNITRIRLGINFGLVCISAIRATFPAGVSRPCRSCGSRSSSRSRRGRPRVVPSLFDSFVYAYTAYNRPGGSSCCRPGVLLPHSGYSLVSL